MSAPHIRSTSPKPGVFLDLATYLQENRTIFIGPELTADLASVVTMQLLALADDRAPISLYINCHGGSVPAGLAIVDMIDFVSRETPVHTFCIGECVGVALAVLASGREGARAAFPSTRLTLFQDWYGVESLWGAQSQDRSERDRLLTILRSLLAHRTNLGGMTPGQFHNAFTDLRFFGVDAALKLGIIDRVCGAGKMAPAAEEPPRWQDTDETEGV
jgi:ATP-dependent Clp protease protease subunit